MPIGTTTSCNSSAAFRAVDCPCRPRTGNSPKALARHRASRRAGAASGCRLVARRCPRWGRTLCRRNVHAARGGRRTGGEKRCADTKAREKSHQLQARRVHRSSLPQSRWGCLRGCRSSQAEAVALWAIAFDDGSQNRPSKTRGYAACLVAVTPTWLQRNREPARTSANPPGHWRITPTRTLQLFDAGPGPGAQAPLHRHERRQLRAEELRRLRRNGLPGQVCALHDSNFGMALCL